MLNDVLDCSLALECYCSNNSRRHSTLNPVVWRLNVQESEWRCRYAMISGFNGDQPIRFKIFGIPRVGIAGSYPMLTGHVMRIKVNDNYRWLFKCGW